MAVSHRASIATVRIPRVRRMPATVGVEHGDFREIRHVRDGFVRNDVGQSTSESWPRSPPTAFVWIWHTRDSVTPRISPISARVSPSK